MLLRSVYLSYFVFLIVFVVKLFNHLFVYYSGDDLDPEDFLEGALPLLSFFPTKTKAEKNNKK